MGRSGDPRKRDTHMAWHGTGSQVAVPADALTGARLDRTIATLAPGEHLWISMTIHRVKPERMRDPGQTTYLDTENLLMAGAIGCYRCEQPYELAKNLPCPGDAGA